MLDISIPQLQSKYKTEEQIKDFLTKLCKIEAKTDGVKLTLVKIPTESKDPLDNFIVAYKGSVFYRGEFDYAKEFYKTSFGNSQFSAVFDHLETLPIENIKKIPDNTELFCEFLVQKNTVMSEYTKTGQIILLGSTKSASVQKFGKVETNPETFDTSKNAEFSKLLNFLRPPFLFKGKLFPTSELFAGVKNQVLSKKLKGFSKVLEKSEKEADFETYCNTIIACCIDLDSEFGGKEEGIVIANADGFFKAQQEYQLDKDARRNKKLRFMGTEEEESAYWKDVLEVSEMLADKAISAGFSKESDIQKGLNFISKEIKSLNFEKAHSKKNTATVMDDVQFNARNFYLKRLEGNNGALVIGKFRILTNGHVKMIETARKNSDICFIGLVTSKDTKDTKDLRLKALRETFPESSGFKVIELVSGNLFTAFKKAGTNINTVYAGSDRLDDYKTMLQKVPGINVSEIERTDEDISATKVIEKISDFKFFKSQTPRAVHKLYNEYVETYA